MAPLTFLLLTRSGTVPIRSVSPRSLPLAPAAGPSSTVCIWMQAAWLTIKWLPIEAHREEEEAVVPAGKTPEEHVWWPLCAIPFHTAGKYKQVCYFKKSFYNHFNISNENIISGWCLTLPACAPFIRAVHLGGYEGWTDHVTTVIDCHCGHMVGSWFCWFPIISME